MYVCYLGAGFRGRFCCSGRRSGGSYRWQAHRVPSPGHSCFFACLNGIEGTSVNTTCGDDSVFLTEKRDPGGFGGPNENE